MITNGGNPQSDFWNRRANELHREMLSRDKTVEDLRKKNYALALKLDELKFGVRPIYLILQAAS